MAKTKDTGTELAVARPQGGALAAPSQFARSYDLEGGDASDLMMPRVILHQGKISKKLYGDHPEGTFLDNMTMAPLASLRFTPIGVAWKDYTGYGENLGDPLRYYTRNRAEVPPGELEWNGDEPPRCETRINFLVLFEGAEMPMCLSFKLSSKKQRGQAKALNVMEKTRATMKRSPGLYELIADDTSNDKGEWKEPVVRPVGDPSDELNAVSLTWFNALKGQSVKIADQESASGHVEAGESTNGQPLDADDIG